MVVVLLTAVFVGVLVHRRITKRRARKRALKLAAAQAVVNRTVSSPVATKETFPEDEVIITERESTSTSRPSSLPPYSTPSPHPYELSDNRPPHLTVPRFEYSGTYVRDKPPPYSATVPQIQNS